MPTETRSESGFWVLVGTVVLLAGFGWMLLSPKVGPRFPEPSRGPARWPRDPHREDCTKWAVRRVSVDLNDPGVLLPFRYRSYEKANEAAQELTRSNRHGDFGYVVECTEANGKSLE